FFTLHQSPCSSHSPYTTLFRSRRKHLLSFLLAERLGFLVKLSLVEEGTAVAGQAVAYGRETDNKQAIIAAQQQLAAILWRAGRIDRKSTRLNSSHVKISYAVFC